MNGGEGGNRPLRVIDALSYLDRVKNQFDDRQVIYNEFLEIMKEFKSQSTDTPGVIRRVRELFRGYPELIIGFNTFLPEGYEIRQEDIMGLEEDHPGKGPRQSSTSTSASNPAKSPNPGQMSGSVITPVSESSSIAEKASTPTPVASSLSSRSVPSAMPATTPATPMPEKKVPTPSVSKPSSSSSPASSGPSQPESNSQFDEAINLIQKIRTRYLNNNGVFREFLTILNEYKRVQPKTQEMTADVYSKMAHLLRNDLDLLEEFTNFLPEMKEEQQRLAQIEQQRKLAGNQTEIKPEAKEPKKEPKAEPEDQLAKPATSTTQVEKATPIVPSKRKNNSGSSPAGTSSKKRLLSGITLHEAAKYATDSELIFFQRVQSMLKETDAYHQFLKCISLYNNEIINRNELILLVEPIIGKSPELLVEFGKILGKAIDLPKSSMNPSDHGNKLQITPKSIQIVPAKPSPSSLPLVKSPPPNPAASVSLPKPNPAPTPYDIDYSNARHIGSSYRSMPKEHRRPPSKDPLAASVLNDIWVSLPTWSEDPQFSSTKKNQYEDVIIRCEDERFELDNVIEANLHTIKIFEGVQKKMQRMKDEERVKFKLEDTLGGTSNVIQRRAIHRIYGDKAADIIDGLKKSPSLTVPVVLKRLKAKNEEWRQSQKHFNRLWKDQLEKNYLKSMDHQGMNFRATDQKFLRPKNLINEIEATCDEMAMQGNENKPHYHTRVPDRRVIKDATSLIMHAIRKHNLTKPEKEQVKEIISRWLPSFLRPDDPKKFNLMYCGNTHFLLLRLHAILCQRLEIIRDKAAALLKEWKLSNSMDKETANIGCVPTLGVEVDEYYKAFLELVKCFYDGNVDHSVYEDTLREMFTTSAYHAFTLDKLILQISKFSIEITQKESALNIHQYHREENNSPGHIVRHMSTIHDIPVEEHVYRKRVENELEEEFLFRVTTYMVEDVNKISIQLMNIEDEDTETVQTDEASEKEDLGKYGQYLPDSLVSLEQRFLRRNVTAVMKTEPNRHEQVRTTPGTLSVQAAVKKGLNNKKIRYIKGSHSSELIPGKIHRARVAYRKANGYAAKKHSRFHEFVEKWLQKNPAPKDEVYGEKLLRFGTAEVECFPHKTMKNIATDLCVNKSFVTSYGSIGKCSSCGYAVKKTANINGERYCGSCALEKFPENKSAKFEETDAKFKCYAGVNGKSCGADQLSYREFYIGTCCKDAAHTGGSLYKYERAEIVNEIYKDVREEEGIAEKKAEDAKKKVAETAKMIKESEKVVNEALKNVEKANAAFIDAQKAEEESNAELGKIKTFRRKVQTRSLFLTEDAMNEDNTTAEPPEPKKSRKAPEEDNKPKCRICFELFDENHPKAVLTSCGHTACLNCLSSLPQKTCPSCRKKFTKRNILQVFEDN
ncbi:Oidioi.mRNA.OKI2018_I69.chr1.g2742.t1.cds [Oikopleura dioica]|uniref:Oidioi.mRNA.OKI2018_I69.chr1.g2742.t1.cds n=1 Tax=Oikopleura dioica TaxID=34765 RepID=A0ABN7SXA1_OIKDI|nr:Oidioi.mRNA.OKI2018_I69.chr1.g2742.t1.cds [Oikopleura dioica]